MSITLVIGFWASCAVCFWLGLRHGRTAERYRAEHILQKAIRTRWSPTAHQALICLAESQSEEEMVEVLESMGRKI